MCGEFLLVKKRRRRGDPARVLNVRVPPKMKALLVKVAKREGLKVAVVVRKYLRDGLKKDSF